MRRFGLVGEQGQGIAEEHPAVRGFDDPAEIAVVSRNCDTLECACFRTESDSVHGSHPKPAVPGAINVVDLVVRQAEGVICTEVLVVFVDVVFVESAESTDPDMAVGVFGEGVHFLVG